MSLSQGRQAPAQQAGEEGPGRGGSPCDEDTGGASAGDARIQMSSGWNSLH